MHRLRILLIAAIFVLPPVSAATEDALLRELDAANQAFATAILNKDIDHLVGDYTDDACVLAPSHPRTCGLAAIRALWTQIANSAPSAVGIETLAAGSAGALAYATGVLRITDANEKVHEYNFVLVLKDVSGTWKLHLDTWTPR